MTYDIIKVAITAGLVVLISESAKRSTLVGAILASVPLVSVLAMLWLYIDTHDVSRISALSTSVFWLVLPSLLLFVTLPMLLRQGVNFYLGMGISVAATAVGYWLMMSVLGHYGIKL